MPIKLSLIILLWQIMFSVAHAEQGAAVDYGRKNTIPDTSMDKHITLAAANISHLVEKDQSGIYQRIFTRALSKTNYTTKEVFYPFRRALLEFEHHKIDCTYSSTEVLEEMLGAHAVIASYPLGAFYFYVFTAQNTPSINSLSELQGLSVGGINGQDNYYLKLLPQGLHFKLLNTDKQGIEMLNLGRLNAFIAALPDVNPYLDKLSYNPDLVLFKSFDRITCHNTPKNRRFLDTLSAELRKLKENGEYQSIAGELYLDF